MAASRKKPVSSAKKSNRQNGSNQFWSVIMFAVGILVLLFAVIKGESAWLFIHNFLFGLFGISVYVIPIILIYVSIMIATDKSTKAVAGKIIQGVILLLLFSAMIQIVFVGSVRGDNFLDKLIELYKSGVAVKGGGLFSALLSWPLLALFKKTGATIIILLLLFVFVMLLTNFSIVDFLGLFYKPIKKMKEAVDQTKEEDFKLSPGAKRFDHGLKTPPNEPMPPESKRKRFDNIDIPMPKGKEPVAEDNNILPESPDELGEPLPIHPVISPKITLDKLEEKVKTANAELETIIKKAVDVPQIIDNNDELKEKPCEPIIEQDGQTRLYEQNDDINVYKYPPISLLHSSNTTSNGEDAQNELKLNADTLVDTLKSFGVQTRIVDIHRGPSVTRYELQPSAGVKISKITGLSDDIALNLAAAGVRIEAPIPGKAAVGIEVPNKVKDMVTLRELLESSEFDNSKSKLAFALGRDIEGKVIIGDIAKMPHIIIAGTTGSGKSVCTNSIIMSILFHASPDEVRLVLIDPKMVEFKAYDGIPHLLIPVVTDPRKAAGALNWAVNEMLKRYRLFADNNVRDLGGYNEMARETEGIDPLPQIVIAIDELADLMMAASNEVEDAICRLAQMARAAGMHLIIATQRPTVDVITGLIKANIPSRIALTVSSQIDSRTIIDVAGAEKLLGNGDMLYYPSGIPKPVRVQGCFCSTKEVEAVVSYIKNEIKADYDKEIMDEIEKNVPVPKGENSNTENSVSNSEDSIIEQAIEILVDAGQASTSFLQRKLKLGYARAARIIDELEEMGIVGPFEGAKPRAVLMTKEQWYQRKLQGQSVSHNEE